MFQSAPLDQEKYLKDRNSRLLAHETLRPALALYQRQHQEAIAELQEHGLVHLRGFFSRTKILQISEFVDTLVAQNRHMSRIRDYTRERPQADGTVRPIYHDSETIAAHQGVLGELTSSVQIKDPLLNLPGLLEIIFEQRILEIASAYHDSIPLMTFAKVKKTFVSPIPAVDTQLFHVDIGSWKILKVVVYLHDVDAGGGPFSYVLGSHREKFSGWEQQYRQSDTEITSHYSAARLHKCFAEAGDIFIVETTGFHKGEAPTLAARNALIFNFCVHPEYGLPTPDIRIRRDDFEGLSGLAQATAGNLNPI